MHICIYLWVRFIFSTSVSLLWRHLWKNKFDFVREFFWRGSEKNSRGFKKKKKNEGILKRFKAERKQNWILIRNKIEIGITFLWIKTKKKSHSIRCKQAGQPYCRKYTGSLKTKVYIHRYSDMCKRTYTCSYIYNIFMDLLWIF